MHRSRLVGTKVPNRSEHVSDKIGDMFRLKSWIRRNYHGGGRGMWRAQSGIDRVSDPRRFSPSTHPSHLESGFQELCAHLGIEKPEDWYSVKPSNLLENGSSFLSRHFGGSLDRMLKEMYPRYEWHIRKVHSVPSKFWSNAENRKSCFEWLCDRLGIKEMDDWYAIGTDRIKEVGGGPLLDHYGGSIAKMLREMIPDRPWQEWRLQSVPLRFWDNPKNQKECLVWLAEQFGVKKLDDWYNVRGSDVRAKGGAGLLSWYSGSVARMLMGIHPEHPWKVWRFGEASPRFWDDEMNRKEFFRWIAGELGVDRPEDWDKVTEEDIAKRGGDELLKKYDGSLVKALSDVYPDVKVMNRMGPVPPGFWRDAQNVRRFVDRMATELNIKQLDDWYKISNVMMVKQGASTLLEIYGGKMNFLSTVYPEHDWTYSFGRVWQLYNVQHRIMEYAKRLFPEEKIVFNHKDTTLRHKRSGFPMQLDVFVPSLMLAFEYQGQQHYHPQFLFGSVEMQQKRDKEKREACYENGITLVEVPYWWDGSFESLVATLHQARPDLVPNQGEGAPIPVHPPAMEPLKKGRKAAFKLLEAERWREYIDPKDWWMSEKFDGIRAFWDGQRMQTIDGREIPLPEHLAALLPQVEIDGELWIGYNLGESLESILKSDNSPHWSEIRYMAFDVPNHRGTFEERYRYLQSSFTQHPFVRVVEMTKCTGRNHLQQFEEHIYSKEGEGVMLRQPESLYQQGRSYSLQKVERTLDDEAKVIDPSTNRCLLPSGVEFTLQSDVDLVQGSIVTFSHDGYSRDGSPTSPKLIKTSFGKSWNKLIKDHLNYEIDYSDRHFQRRCSGCGEKLDRQQLRVLATVTHQPTNSSYIAAFCVGKVCITGALKAPGNTIYPPFRGAIYVPPELGSEVDHLPKNIEWRLGSSVE